MSSCGFPRFFWYVIECYSDQSPTPSSRISDAVLFLPTTTPHYCCCCEAPCCVHVWGFPGVTLICSVDCEVWILGVLCFFKKQTHVGPGTRVSTEVKSPSTPSSFKQSQAHLLTSLFPLGIREETDDAATDATAHKQDRLLVVEFLRLPSVLCAIV